MAVLALPMAVFVAVLAGCGTAARTVPAKAQPGPVLDIDGGQVPVPKAGLAWPTDAMARRLDRARISQVPQDELKYVIVDVSGDGSADARGEGPVVIWLLVEGAPTIPAGALVADGWPHSDHIAGRLGFESGYVDAASGKVTTVVSKSWIACDAGKGMVLRCGVELSSGHNTVTVRALRKVGGSLVPLGSPVVIPARSDVVLDQQLDQHLKACSEITIRSGSLRNLWTHPRKHMRPKADDSGPGEKTPGKRKPESNPTTTASVS
jgi:hypothetical protein